MKRVVSCYRASSFAELNGRKGETELRVFHARHEHALLTAVIHVFRGRHAACTAYPLSSTATRLLPGLQVFGWSSQTGSGVQYCRTYSHRRLSSVCGVAVRTLTVDALGFPV